MKNSDEKIASVVNSLAGIRRAEAPSFLAGKVLMRIKEKPGLSIWERGAELIARPSIALTFMLVVLVFNLYFFFLTPGGKNEISSSIPAYDYTVTDFPNEDENIWP